MKEFFKSLMAAGWRPHVGQRAYLRSAARYRVLACGRRWGKTDAAAADIARRIACTNRSVQIAVAPTRSQARIVFERVVWMLGVVGVVCVPSLSPFPSVRVSNDGGTSTVHIFDVRSGHRAPNLRGVGADHILIDEAAFVPESLITETVMPMLATNNGRLTLLSTPFGKNHFYRYFMMGQTGENGFWSRRAPSAENPHVNREYLASQQGVLSENAFRTEYGAEFLETSSTVFGYEFLSNALSLPEVPRGQVVVGVDWGRYRDQTAAVAVRGTRMQAEVLACEAWSGETWSSLVGHVARFARSVGATKAVHDATGAGDVVGEQLAGPRRRRARTVRVQRREEARPGYSRGLDARKRPTAAAERPRLAQRTGVLRGKACR